MIKRTILGLLLVVLVLAVVLLARTFTPSVDQQAGQGL
jgi:hypothetical protein